MIHDRNKLTPVVQHLFRTLPAEYDTPTELLTMLIDVADTFPQLVAFADPSDDGVHWRILATTESAVIEVSGLVTKGSNGKSPDAVLRSWALRELVGLEMTDPGVTDDGHELEIRARWHFKFRESSEFIEVDVARAGTEKYRGAVEALVYRLRDAVMQNS